MKLSINSIDALILDFDGVLTDNTVYLNQDGIETVRCNRGDGLALENSKKLGIRTYIVSSEKNNVVSKRAEKLDIPVLFGVENKVDALMRLSEDQGLDLERLLYVGNDLNDYHAIQKCGFSACPSDSHKRIKDIVTFNLKTKGGMGIVREILEDILNIDMIEALYEKKG